MARGTRGGSNDAALPNIATSDTIVGGDYDGQKIQAAVIAYGPDSAPTVVTTGTPLPVVQTGTAGLPTGAATAANQSSELTLVGAVTETAPASDTASSGLNGRLQRIAQRLTSLIALLPASLGQKAMSASLAVTLASDQTTINVASPGLAGGIQQTVTTVGTSAAACPASPLAGRASVLIQAADTNTAPIWIGKSTVTADTASTGGIKLLPGQSVPVSLATAVVLYAISTAASQSAITLEVAA